MSDILNFNTFLNESSDEKTVCFSGSTDDWDLIIKKATDAGLKFVTSLDDWEINTILNVSTDSPVDESLLIQANLSGESVKRGDTIYITAILNRPGNRRISANSIGVIQARVTNIYNSIQPLNKILQ